MNGEFFITNAACWIEEFHLDGLPATLGRMVMLNHLAEVLRCWIKTSSPV